MATKKSNNGPVNVDLSDGNIQRISRRVAEIQQIRQRGEEKESDLNEMIGVILDGAEGLPAPQEREIQLDLQNGRLIVSRRDAGNEDE